MKKRGAVDMSYCKSNNTFMFFLDKENVQYVFILTKNIPAMQFIMDK